MKLYYAPGACSLADHLALEETGLAYDLVKVDLKAKRTEDGRDYAAVNPKGYVPALELDEGDVLTENLAILGYIAERSASLMPPAGLRRWRVMETAAYISTEIHKGHKPFFNPAASDAEKDEARANLARRYALLDEGLSAHEFVAGDEITIADCYLFVTVRWSKKFGVEVPARISAWFDRMAARPAFRRALEQEGLN